jgi:hypothetical protein
MTTSLSYSTNSTADQEKKSVSNCRIESFIYLCNHELRFGLESILEFGEAFFFIV